jgi:two-component system sensor histidine kinase KdpD
MEAAAERGKLLTYLGIAPGVGKTYSMLRDARAKRKAGAEVVAAYLERHGRAGTAAQLGDLEVLPTRSVTYRGATFQELDVEGVLERHPDIALVDELAHADVPGQRHRKRWQDVDELLGHGVDVWTTLNLANIESLRSVVAEITGVRPAEPVPDSFVRSGEVRLVDLPPAALRRRLKQGLVIGADRAETALTNYFRFANLAALRELAELWLDDSVPDPAQAYLSRHPKAGERRGRVVVGLEGSAGDEWLIRYAANLADCTGAELRGVHVRPTDGIARRAKTRLESDRNLIEELHGTLVEVGGEDVASSLIRAARNDGASQLVIGSGGGSRWSHLVEGSTVRQIVRAAGDLPIQLVDVGKRTGSRQAHRGGVDDQQ